MRRRAARAVERSWEILVLASGFAGTGILLAIFASLLANAGPIFREYGVGRLIGGEGWFPVIAEPRFGFLPLVLGSLWVTGGALGIAVPIGVGAAVFIAEFAPARLREPMKGVVEFLVAIPSVIFGFLALKLLVPAIAAVFGLDTGLSGLAGSITLALMAMPTIVSVSEDALRAVPREYHDGSLALGTSRWQTVYRVVVPAAGSGIFAAVMLGMGRAIGETMAVMMVTGNAAVLPDTLLEPMRTMTATIAAEMGEVVRGSDHYHALFGVGLTLFAITFVVNLVADGVLEGSRAGVGRR